MNIEFDHFSPVPRRPHWRWRRSGDIAARVGTFLGAVALMTFLWWEIINVVLWVFGALP